MKRYLHRAEADRFVTIYKVYPITQAEEAQDLMQSGKSAGKIVLVVKESHKEA